MFDYFKLGEFVMYKAKHRPFEVGKVIDDSEYYTIFVLKLCSFLDSV